VSDSDVPIRIGDLVALLLLLLVLLPLLLLQAARIIAAAEAAAVRAKNRVPLGLIRSSFQFMDDQL
jgi:hypothetical protein